MGRGLLIVEASRSHSDTPNSVWLLWTSDRPVTETSNNTQHSQETDIHASGGIRTHNPSKQADADPRFDRVATGISKTGIKIVSIYNTMTHRKK
jgi:hypothetical protein